MLCHIGYPRLYDALVGVVLVFRRVGGSKNKTYLSVAALQGLNLS